MKLSSTVQISKEPHLCCRGSHLAIWQNFSPCGQWWRYMERCDLLQHTLTQSMTEDQIWNANCCPVSWRHRKLITTWWQSGSYNIIISSYPGTGFPGVHQGRPISSTQLVFGKKTSGWRRGAAALPDHFIHLPSFSRHWNLSQSCKKLLQRSELELVIHCIADRWQ